MDKISHDNAEPPMRDLVEEMRLKAGQVFGVIRVAVTGQMYLLLLFETMEIIGKEKVLQRVNNAIDRVNQSVSVYKTGSDKSDPVY